MFQREWCHGFEYMGRICASGAKHNEFVRRICTCLYTGHFMEIDFAGAKAKSGHDFVDAKGDACNGVLCGRCVSLLEGFPRKHLPSTPFPC